jgi:hypothetical protein
MMVDLEPNSPMATSARAVSRGGLLIGHLSELTDW